MSVTRARIWLCADDYGISPSVNAAIRDLIARGRINATSVMVAAPSFQRSEASFARCAQRRCAARGDRPACDAHRAVQAAERGLRADLRRCNFCRCRRRLVLAHACAASGTSSSLPRSRPVRAFVAAFGRAPDFIDGHQHVHLFPQMRDAFLTVAKAKAPLAWVRQCGRIVPLAKRLADTKGLLLDVLSVAFALRAAQLAVRTNPAFAGTYDFAGRCGFRQTVPELSRRAAGQQRGHVPSRHCRRRAQAPRSADHAARARIRLFRRRALSRRARAHGVALA